MLRILFVCAAAFVASIHGAEMKEVFAWKEVEYNWPTAELKEAALKTGSYIPENNLPLGLAGWKDKLFITVPRWKAGVASSLNYVKLGTNERTPKLTPYPSWDSNYIPTENKSSQLQESAKGRDNAPKAEVTTSSLKDNSTIVSVFRLWVDKCDRLWVMDTGLADILGAPTIMAKPSLVIFDLNTDTLIRRYFFRDADLKENSFFANVVVDVNPKYCDNAFAYVPDLGGYGVVVYSFKDNTSWRVKHHYFHFDPLAGQYNVGGIEFQWTDGVFGLALSNPDEDGLRRVFFHAFSSTKEFEVSNKVLQNETWATSSSNFHDFKLVGDRGVNTQASANYFDEKTGVLFYSQVNRDGVACWNSAKPMNPDNTELIASDKKLMEFPNDLKVFDDKLWVLSDKLPRFLYKSLESNEVNYRILNVPVEDAIRGTICG